MSQYRIPSEKSKYYIPREVYLTTVHYCLQYPLWAAELKTDPGAGSAIDYSRDRVQTSSQYDATSEIGMRRAEISRKKETVDTVAQEIAGAMYEWLILGVCHGLTYYQLRERGIPCGRNMYFDMRRQFYFEMSRRI